MIINVDAFLASKQTEIPPVNVNNIITSSLATRTTYKETKLDRQALVRHVINTHIS